MKFGIEQILPKQKQASKTSLGVYLENPTPLPATAPWLESTDGEKRREFDEWFGDSVITVSGNPKDTPAILYHFWLTPPLEDPAAMNPYDPDATELGLHFGNQATAAARARGFGVGAHGITIPAVVRMVSPLRMQDAGSFIFGRDHKRENALLFRSIAEDRRARGLPLPPKKEIERLQTNRDVRDYLTGLGYDGMVYTNNVEKSSKESTSDSVIVFHPDHQLRSAVDGGRIIGEKGEPLFKQPSKTS